MQLQNILEKRRSVRVYQNREVEDEKIKEVIAAAINAPSWKNSQTTRYYVVKEKSLLEKMKKTLPEFNQNNVKNAPVLLVSTVVLNRSGFEKDGRPSNELSNEWGYYDCGLHDMILLLKACELGLSTLIMGIRDANQIRSLLAIPDTEGIASVIAMGYSDFHPEKPKRKSVEEITCFY